MRRVLTILKILMLTCALGSNAKAAVVGLELVLAVDVSGSVNAADFNIQRGGYEAAFRNLSVINAIQAAPTGSIAVTLAYWSSAGQFQQAVPWSVIGDSISSNLFADAVAAAARPFSGGTDVAAAITGSAGLFGVHTSNRQVIDVSGDGSSSEAAAAAARNAFLNGGGGIERAINAVWIEDPPFFFVGQGNTNPSAGSADPLIFGLSVIGGPNSFQQVVSSFSDFPTAVAQKIEREVVGGGNIPEPGSAVIWLGLAFVTSMGSRRRMRL